MTTIQPFTDEQARVLVNLEQRYQVWMEAEQSLQALPYNLVRKDVGGYVYLYEVLDRRNNARSLGRWTDESAAQLEAYRATKEQARYRRDAAREPLAEACRLYRALRLPLLASDAGMIAREADRRRLLGHQLIVVGTNCTPAYAVEAGGFIQDMPDETQDFDLAWAAEEATDGQPLWDMLKAVDPTFTVNSEKSFQARNAKAYEVEILAAPSRIGTMFRTDRPRPVALPEQEWLLHGRFVDRVIVCRDGAPARIVAPDPRWFALQKIWMSDQAKRNPLKRPKDLKQGLALLDAVTLAMPQYPLDAAFEDSLPEELREPFARWARNRPEPPAPNW